MSPVHLKKKKRDGADGDMIPEIEINFLRLKIL